ncbi:MAG TPA: hypothetical protein VGH71_02265 [Gammaproteobacteria bacterium]|jgi:hypothetical protein
MNLRVCFGLLMLCLLPLAARADDASAAAGSSPPAAADSDPIGQFLKGQSFSLGYSYAQGTFKMSRGATQSQLTDNGRASPIINYTTGEWVLDKFPMKYGDGAIGVNLGGSFGEQDTHFQLNPNSSAIIGQDLGSKVTGDYLSVAPLLYLRLGPIYPDTDSYWLFGYGPGVALYHFSGTPLFYTATPGAKTPYLATAAPVSSSATLFIYQTWRWQFHYGNWDVLFTGKQLSGRKVDGYNTSYEDYSLGLAYTIRF